MKNLKQETDILVSPSKLKRGQSDNRFVQWYFVNKEDMPQYTTGIIILLSCRSFNQYASDILEDESANRKPQLSRKNLLCSIMIKVANKAYALRIGCRIIPHSPRGYTHTSCR
jgi:hypothetical protein